MVGKVKYPVRAAYARFTPLYNHLTNMAEYLEQARLMNLSSKAYAIMREVGALEREIKPLLEKPRPD